MLMETETTTALKSTAADEVIRRNLDKLRREMGATIRKAMDDPTVIEVMLNPDGTVWTDKLGIGMEYLCDMSEVQALQMLGTIAHMLGTVVNYHHPKVEGELPGDGSRVEGVIPPIAPRPTFNLRKIAATAAGLGRGVIQTGRTVVNTVRGARNTQTATFRGIASAYDAAKEGGVVGAAGYIAASTPGVRHLVNAAKSGGLRNMAGYVAATALFGSQSERAQKYLSRNEETMTPGNRSMPSVPAPGNANVSSPESVAERILRS